MKRAILTFGLFSLVMVLTSFTTPETSTTLLVDNNDTAIEAVGSGSTGRTKRLDAVGSGATGRTKRLDAVGSGATGKTKRLDAVGSGATGGTKRLD